MTTINRTNYLCMLFIVFLWFWILRKFTPTSVKPYCSNTVPQMHPLEIWMATWNNKLDNYCQIVGSLILYSCKFYLPHCLTKTQPINFTSSFLQLVTLHWKCWKSSSNDCHFGRLKNDYLKIISLVAQIFQNAISRYFNLDVALWVSISLLRKI